jgi:hypothetical protein
LALQILGIKPDTFYQKSAFLFGIDDGSIIPLYLRFKNSLYGEQVVVEVSTNVFRFDTGPFNWYIVREGRELTLVDAGFPRHCHSGGVRAAV